MLTQDIVLYRRHPAVTFFGVLALSMRPLALKAGVRFGSIALCKVSFLTS